MDEELKALLESAQGEDFDWRNLLRALQHRGYPSGKEALKALRVRMKSFQTAMEASTRNLLAAEAKGLFARHPKLESFAWHQYTPYWIDGDACSFSSNMGYCSINDLNYYSEPEDPDLQTAARDVRETLAIFDDAYLMYQLFGDHKTVKVNRQGIFVETYEHE